MRELHPPASRLRRSRSRRLHPLRHRLETDGQRPQRRKTMKKNLWLAAALIAPLALHAQQQTGSIHGHVQDPAGTPLANAQVQVCTDGKNAKYTFTADANGDYQGDNIAPGTYV